jgi:hypothetical protein
MIHGAWHLQGARHSSPPAHAMPAPILYSPLPPSLRYHPPPLMFSGHYSLPVPPPDPSSQPPAHPYPPFPTVFTPPPPLCFFRSLLSSKSTAGSQFTTAAAAAAGQTPNSAAQAAGAGAVSGIGAGPGAAAAVAEGAGPGAGPGSGAAGGAAGGAGGPSLESEYRSLLLWPGPDVLVVDEAHVLKKEKNLLSRVLAQVDSQHTHNLLTQPTSPLPCPLPCHRSWSPCTCASICMG